MDQTPPFLDFQADSLLKLIHIIPENGWNLFIIRNSLYMPSGQEFPEISPLEDFPMPPNVWDQIWTSF